MTRLRTEVPVLNGIRDAEVIESKRVEGSSESGNLKGIAFEDDGFLLNEIKGWKR